MPEKCVLDVKALSVRRGATWILREVCWCVQRGQHWAIVGANGSGKTSLLSVLAGYLTPTAGVVELLGHRYGKANWPELRKRIGLVSSSVRQMMAESEPALLSVISGKYAMIDYWGRAGRGDRAQAMKILDQVECRHLAERPWQFLSQGERQRVLIGRALMARPDLLILDEPCAGLDPAAREHFLEFLNRMGRSKKAPTMIFVTHHVEEILPVFANILILKSGQVLCAGATRTTLTSANLSGALNLSAVVQKRAGRFGLVIGRRTGTRAARIL